MRGLDEAEVVTEERKKREKPMWYQRTVRRFTAYTQDKLRLQILIAQLETEFPSNTAQISLSPGRSIGSTSDQTGGCGDRRLELELEIRDLRLKIREVDMILNSKKIYTRRGLIFYKVRYWNESSLIGCFHFTFYFIEFLSAPLKLLGEWMKSSRYFPLRWCLTMQEL